MMYGPLTTEEMNNMVILALKAMGMNDNLCADGTLGEEAKIAALKYLKSPYKAHSPIETVMLFARKYISNSLRSTHELLKMFFARNGSPLP